MEQLRTQTHRTLTTKKVWKVAIYLRLSQEDGKDESQSISNQRKIIHDYLEDQFSGEYEVIETYIDDGISAINAINRPEFLRMISDMERGKVDTIICKSLSRAFRNSGDQADYLRVIFPQFQTRFITIDSPHIDTFLNPELVYDMTISMYGSFNEGYPLMISKEVNRVFRNMRKNGEFTAGFVPYGYVKGKTDETKYKLFIDEEAAGVIRKIYHWYVYGGMSHRKITEKLNSLGILNPANYKRQHGINYGGNNSIVNELWGTTTVSRILRDEMYIGNMVQGRYRTISPVLKKCVRVPESEWVIVKNTHEPIISDKLFEQAQALRQKHQRTPKHQREVDLFSGFLRCADCGLKMIIKRRTYMTKKGLKDSVHYCCTTFAKKSKEACSNHFISRTALEPIVLKAIQLQIETVENLESSLNDTSRKKLIQTEQTKLEANLRAKRLELSKFENITEGLYMDWKTEVLSKNEYIRMKSSFEEKLSHLKQVINNIQTELEENKNRHDEITPYLQAFQEHKNITELNRAILIDLVDTIHIHDDKSITIEFKFADVHKKISEIAQD